MIGMGMTTKWHEYLHPAPRCPTGIPRAAAKGIGYKVVITPRSLLMLTNFIYNYVSTGRSDFIVLKA
jgi:hypothetical protein